EAGLAYYDRLVDALLEAGIEPFVTLYHWDLPQALENRLGWTSRATPVAFAEYASVVARRLGDRVTYWATHNEPWCSAFLGYHTGHLAPGYHDFKAALSASHNLLLSHGLAVPAIRAAVSRPLQVGIVLNLTPAYPASDTEEDQAAARRFDGYFNRWFLDPLAGRGYPQDMWEYYGEAVPQVAPEDVEAIAAPIDWLGVNYYERNLTAHDPEAEPPQTRRIIVPALDHTADREVYPEGLDDTLVRVHNDYGFGALYVTE